MTLSKADEAESRVAGSDAGREDRLQISTKDQAQNRTKGCPGEELPKLGFLMCPESRFSYNSSFHVANFCTT